MRRLSSVVVAGAALAGLPVVLVAAPAQADQADCTAITQRTDSSTDITGPSTPYDLLGMAAAADVADRYVSQPPVRVAVLDTGVRVPGDGGIVVHQAERIAQGDDGVVDGSGTEVAGLVAGAARAGGDPVGFAPHTEIVDVQVAAVRVGERDQVPPTPDSVAQGLDWVAQNAKPLNIKVATVAFDAGSGSGLEDAVAKAQAAGVVVVAATGDPVESTSTDTAEAGQPGPQVDAADDGKLPAFAGVVAVNTTVGGVAGADDATYVLPNSDTTVAVPTADGVSYGLNGKTCRVAAPSTSAATGEVAGVVALLWQRFPEEQPAQIVARLVNTASGTTDDPTPLTGYGIVQPLDALTRPVDPAEDGTVQRSRPEAGPDGPVSPPSAPTDLLASTRDDAVWWALIGGGLVVVALLLRPVLARRRQ
ncbi:S8 family serine peptidase [Nocardioides mangrovi]|uniref:S8 family serine peptidase n=1 Tax=Nocardioides mangrovi TaxID=2874580 RepID=A0ABS7UDH1_9ACTN|nr:S8 family serine peptidase [Nocardioides mangrovi]MBZ5739036.1 S8 family serine peptidase [Nocardioides mangrovi]